MIYTTYLSKMKDVPAGVTKLLVTRILPKGFNLDKHRDVIYAPELSPSELTLKKYKFDEDWYEFRRSFKREMKKEPMKEKLKKLEEELKEGKDFCLICYEKEHEYCHRRILGEYFKDKGYNWEEI